MTRLIVATRDPRTFDELRELLSGDDVELLAPHDVDIEIPSESGTTFAQNAMDAADYGARASGLVTVAETTGLIVDALDGAPGVSSSRYAGPNATDEENRAEVLNDIREADSQSRSARLVTVVGVAHPDGRLETFESTLGGVVATEERGVEGVGFEPIFELDDGMTIAELLPEQREQVNPRSVALAEARPFIDELLAGQNA